MQAISPAEHEKLCQLISGFLTTRGSSTILPELESELNELFQQYLNALSTLRVLIRAYDSKQVEVRMEMKKIVRKKPVKSFKVREV